jgi:protocatechuate 3,4-dioxygenase beta subunit
MRRRDLLLALGGLSAAALWQAACGSGSSKRTSTATNAVDRKDASVSCVLSPEVTAGPYYVANHLTRRNVTDGRPGVPLHLHLTILDARTCKPVKGADVEIWHADATGVYSGVNGNTKHFLRGHQKSDAQGRVLFDTIYPGWYMGRTTHIHLKVHVGGAVVHTGQLFFPDRTSGVVYRTASYRAHGEADTTNSADTIYAQAGGKKAQLRLSRRRDRSGFDGRIAVGVKT